jgi:hypothetical protein
MPYITQENRKLYKDDLDDLCFALEEQGYPEGDVTYVLYVILARWFKHLPGYSAIADIRGCLAGTLSELDRRFFFQYEDKKIKENGDVDLMFNTTVWEDAVPCGYDECVTCRPEVEDEFFDADGNDTRGGA